MSYVLAIEPHHGQANILRNSVSARTRARLTLVESMDAAMTAIDDEVPNLVILNALIPPHEESRLIARLRNLPNATAPEVLFIPALARPEAQPKRTIIDRFRNRGVRSTGCCPSAFADQLAAYLREWRPDESFALVSLTPGVDGAERRVASRFERVDWARVRIDGAVVDVVDLSLTGAQILSSKVLQPGKSVEVLLSGEADGIRCEAGIVWSGFEIIGAAAAPSVRAGINFKDADRRVLERLYLQRIRSLSTRRLRAPEEDVAPADTTSIVRRPDPRRPRAERQESEDAPWLSTVRLPWGYDARPLNISNTGVLLESGSKVTPGTVVELDLCGPEWRMAVQARFVRSEVAHVNGLGVKYHIAAEFKKRLEFPAPPRIVRRNP